MYSQAETVSREIVYLKLGHSDKKYPHAESVVTAIRRFFAGEPVPLIPTDNALEAAEEAGNMGPGVDSADEVPE